LRRDRDGDYWFVDGLEGNRFAVIAKVHHCIADGVSSVAMGSLMVGPDPDYRPAPRKEWIPRPAPGGTQLLLQELQHRLAAPFGLLRAVAGGDEGGAGSAPPSRAGFRALLESATSAFASGSETPLNVEIGPHRRFDWTRLPFAEVHAIGASAGGTVNDVVLAVASGALRTFLRRRGVAVEQLDFRAIVPVNVRTEGEHAALGNRVSGLLARLPLDVADPWQRLLRVVETTHELKASGQSGAGAFLGQLIELLPTQLLGPLFRQAARSSAANIVITNVPGPRVPVYLLGARQLESYPVVPLAPNQALGIALLSYDDGLSWGLNADWDAVPDLHDLVEQIEASFQELRAVALPHRKTARGAGKAHA
jgi:WS/DGAT/MGAT family acyltransferase